MNDYTPRAMLATAGRWLAGRVTGNQNRRGLSSVGGTIIDLPGSSPAPVGNYQTYRRMLDDPTIALARVGMMGPIIAGHWGFEARYGVPAERKEFFQTMLEPMRAMIVPTGTLALSFASSSVVLTISLPLSTRNCISSSSTLLVGLTGVGMKVLRISSCMIPPSISFVWPASTRTF